MANSPLKQKITDDMKAAMKAQEAARLLTIRTILAALKQREVDERIELSDADVLAILDKMVKQRRDSIKQFIEGNRQDLADIEIKEIDIIQAYLPAQLSASEVEQMVAEAIANCGTTGMAAMGKVMAELKPKLQGRADIGEVSKLVKAKLG